MIEYTILEDAILEAIIGSTNDFIADGWEPLGGIQVMVRDQYFSKTFYQAMIRDMEENAKRNQRRARILQEMSDGVDEAIIVAEEN